jgi:hypothetical protein
MSYHSIVFFHGKPSIADEDVFLICLYITHDNISHVPRGELPLSRIIVPDVEVV